MIELPYKLKTRRYALLFTEYSIEYEGCGIGVYRGVGLSFMEDMVFKMNTAYAEGAGGFIIGKHIMFKEDFE